MQFPINLETVLIRKSGNVLWGPGEASPPPSLHHRAALFSPAPSLAHSRMLLLPFLALVTIPGALGTPIAPRASTCSGTPISCVTAAQWAAFNTTVGGRLQQGYPVARPCFATAGAGVAGSTNLAQCLNVQNLYKNDSFIANNFGAYQNSNWGECQATGAECALDYNLPSDPTAYTLKTCQQGSVSPYYVAVANYQDVIAIFSFAKTYGVPLTIKNSGHDYKGRSSAPNSLGIWTHNIQYITRDETFVGDGCAAGTATVDAISVGAGNGFLSLYEFAEANGITVLGGSSETVGPSGGWIAGAGHGALSNQLGLGVDRAQQFKVVTPTGAYLTVNRCQNTDLFFALRGGGGGTFGVVLETTFSVVSSPTVLQVAYVKYVSANIDVTKAFLTVLIANAQKWADEGWGGYIEPGAIGPTTGGFVLMTPLLNNSAAMASMQPVADFVNSLGNIAQTYEVVEQPTFYQAFQNYLAPNEELVGLGTAVGSRLIPKENFVAGAPAEALLDALVNAANTVGNNIIGLSNSGGTIAYGGAPFQILVTTPINYVVPEGETSAVTPAWRDALWHTLFAPTFDPFTATPSEIATAFKNANNAAQFLRDITPGSGAYQNEATIFEPDHTDSFWGADNYNQLVPIKAKYDPDNLLSCWHCIGWVATDPKYSCYPSAS